MSDKELKKELYDATHNRQPILFWGLSISFISIFFGFFTFYFDGYLLANSEPYFTHIPEDLIGGLLVAFGVLKAIGVIFQKTKLKRVGILVLSAVWTGIFFLAFTFSFGSGYPNPSYMFMAFVAIACYRVSLKGDFD